MDEGHREPVRHLFAAATDMIETAHDAATAGQSEALSAGDYAKAARRHEATARGIAALAEAATATARGIAALAEAATVIAGPSDGESSGRPD